MIVKTKNSTYQVSARGTEFIVRKIAAENPESKALAVGEWFPCRSVAVVVGASALFGDVRTSEVVSVQDSVEGEPEP